MEGRPVHSSHEAMAATRSVLQKMIDSVELRGLPAPAEIMTVRIDLTPGSPGTPPNRHSGPVFGYLLEGEMIFEFEGEPERMITSGEAFGEPGGDVIHYQAGNNLAAAWARFVVLMFGVPGEPMLTLVGEDELAARKHLRAPRPTPAGDGL
jgi:quercetin dioxygenase-like cupin family protein